MFFLLIFAFLAGIVTILSPCILPVLPILLSGAIAKNKKRPLGIILGFIASFTFFTLTLGLIVKAAHLPPDLLRNLSIAVIFAFGLTLISPRLQLIFEKYTSRIVSRSGEPEQRSGLAGGLIIGGSLGLLWTPCVGPIMAGVIALALTGNISQEAIFITLAYSLGTAIPMFSIAYLGGNLFTKFPTVPVQKFFGLLMIITAIALFLNLDRTFQNYVLTAFPNYGLGLTKIEDNNIVKSQLPGLRLNSDTKNLGKPMSDLLNNNLELAPELVPGGQWFNSPPLTLAALRGKVVLVDFWTYTCINCIRTLPYLKTWWERYHDRGLVIIGVHTPEFEFEKEAQNVQKAIADFQIKYPVVQDNNYATWKAYNNQYWPAHYFIDKNGKIRDTHFGEGDYDNSEKIIQGLLAETGEKITDMPIQNPTYQISSRTPETYLGYARLQYLSSPTPVVQDQPEDYLTPAVIPDNTFAYTGRWTVGRERAMPEKDSGLILRFSAQNVYLVIRPKDPKSPGKVQVFLDDQPSSTLSVSDDRLYTLIQLPAAGNHTLHLNFLDSNLELYAFTFG